MAYPRLSKSKQALVLAALVEMTAEYSRRKEDAKFEEAFAELA